MVLALGVVRAVDQEDRHPAAVRAADLDGLEFAATHEPEGPEEDVVGLDHGPHLLPWA